MIFAATARRWRGRKSDDEMGLHRKYCGHAFGRISLLAIQKWLGVLGVVVAQQKLEAQRTH